MRVIFLDVDGVLCTRRSHLVYGAEGRCWDKWDPLACYAVQRACEAGVSIVVSSSWRFDNNKDILWGRLAEHKLLPFVYLPDWKTPDLVVVKSDEGDTCRGHEISAYLRDHPEITDYRILDDTCDMLPEQMKKLIQTDGEEGMLSENIKKLLNWAGALKA